MPGPVPLSQNDFGVLSKILDPESDPFTKNAPIDPSLPPDPHVTDKAVYAEATREEWTVIQKLRSLDEELAATTMRRSSRSSSRKSPSSGASVPSRRAHADRLVETR